MSQTGRLEAYDVVTAAAVGDVTPASHETLVRTGAAATPVPASHGGAAPEAAAAEMTATTEMAASVASATGVATAAAATASTPGVTATSTPAAA